MKKILTFAFILLAFSFTNAQYQHGKNTFGALIGVGGGDLHGTGAIPIAVEYNFLNAIDNKIQFGVFGAYASTKEEFGWWGGEFKYTNIILAAQGNYHFLPGNKWDPFAGVSLGFNIVSASWSGGGASPSASSSGLFWNIQGGVNYWFSPKWAIQARLGYFPYFGIGVTGAL